MIGLPLTPQVLRVACITTKRRILDCHGRRKFNPCRALAAMGMDQGIASLILVAVLDVVVAGALFTLFAPVNRSVSLKAAGFRVAYAAVYLVAIIQHVIALGLLGEPAQALRAIDAYDTRQLRRLCSSGWLVWFHSSDSTRCSMCSAGGDHQYFSGSLSG
jgi:hypothetical protein